MKAVILALLFSFACTVQGGRDTYTSRYDSMNVDDVIGNHRLLHAYIKCMLDEGRCTAEGRELKNHITDALQTGCSRCTEAQKKAIRHVIKHLIEHEHDFWALLVDKYDPYRTYTNKYEAEMEGMTDARRTTRSTGTVTTEAGTGYRKTGTSETTEAGTGYRNTGTAETTEAGTGYRTGMTGTTATKTGFTGTRTGTTGMTATKTGTTGTKTGMTGTTGTRTGTTGTTGMRTGTTGTTATKTGTTGMTGTRTGTTGTTGTMDTTK